jgi:DNA polymerase-3 subunit alpha
MAAPFHNFVTDEKIVTCNSHSASYAVLAYISQWLKVYYPAYFWSGQIYWDVKKGDLDSMIENKRAAQEMGVEFSYPDINLSGENFRVIDEEDPLHEITGKKHTGKQKVLWSLQSVKSVGLKAAQEIVKHQPFKSFEDFYKRVNKRQVNYKVVTNLIYAGCFDQLGDRKDLLIYLAKMAKKDPPKVTSDVLMSEFYRSMGFYEQSIKKTISGFSHRCITEKELAEFCDGDAVVVGGIISDLRTIKTKKGVLIGFVTLTDMDETLDVTCFPESWANYRKIFKVGNVVEIKGTKSEFNGKQNSIQLVDIKIIKESVK